MRTDEVLAMFASAGALLSGHFQLSSGNHSDRYLQCALVTQHPAAARRLAAALAEAFAGKRIDAVLGPAAGGIVIAQEVAHALADAGVTGVRAMFCERREGIMRLRRGFTLAPGENVLAVEDVVTTGGSVREAVDLARAQGADVVGVGSFIDRSTEPVDLGAPWHALARVEARIYAPGECPLCRRGVPVVKPGSRGAS